MARGWCFLLLTLGVCGLSSSVPRQFHVVEENKNWGDAQQYCREEFTDLATIDNETEIDEIRREMRDAGFDQDGLAWIGLKQGKWQWSLADDGDNTEFRNWAVGEPNNQHEECVSMGNSQWHDYPCNTIFYFICYTGTSYVLVYKGRTWTDAQRYCRHHYRDLASVRNNAENNQIASMLGENTVWIGLFRDALEWSDGSNSSFRNWSIGEPSSDSMSHGFCVGMFSSGRWKDISCHRLDYFVCYEALPTVEKISPPLPLYPGEDVTLRCDIPKYTGQHQYVWIKDSSPVPGKTSQTISITLPEDAGQYQCHRHRDSSSVAPYISEPLGIECHDLPNATVEVVSPPPFYSGENVTIRCDIAEYSDWQQYVWLKDNSLVPGKTSQTITITLPEDAGQYQCSGERNNRPVASSVSSSVDIISNDLPTATVEVVSPQSPFYSGDDVTLRCDIPEFSDWQQYTWLKDSSPLPGKTSQTITITLPEDAGQYQCSGERNNRPVASSVSRSVDIISNDLPNATVEVVSPPPFYSGENVTLRCDISEYTDWQQYVWLKDNSPVPGKASQTVSITLPRRVPSPTGRYQCRGERGDRPMASSVSSSVNITVNAPSVVILSPPPPFNSGDVVTLRCDTPESTSGQRVQYVWLKDSKLLPGETSRTVTVGNPASFQCRQKGKPYISRPLEITFIPRLSQTVRVQLPPGVKVPPDDKMQKALLKQIEDKLKAKGLAADAKMSWKKQPDGKVFHKEKKKKRNEL